MAKKKSPPHPAELQAPARVETGEGWELRHGDCTDPRTGLASLDDASVDHFLTDPPYASEIYERCKKNPARSSKKGGENTVNESLAAMTKGAVGSIDEVLVSVAAEVGRLTKRWALVFCNVEALSMWRAELEQATMRYIRCGIWVRRGLPQFSGDRPSQGFEACAITHASSEKLRWNGGGQWAVWEHPRSMGKQRPSHPCPKPLALMERLVLDFTERGDLICDPFAGSGTTAVAALMHGRRFIGWERDPEFFADAARRIAGSQIALPFAGSHFG